MATTKKAINGYPRPAMSIENVAPLSIFFRSRIHVMIAMVRSAKLRSKPNPYELTIAAEIGDPKLRATK